MGFFPAMALRRFVSCSIHIAVIWFNEFFQLQFPKGNGATVRPYVGLGQGYI